MSSAVPCLVGVPADKVAVITASCELCCLGSQLHSCIDEM